MQHIMLGSGVLSLFLGLLALYKGKRTKEVISFGVFCIITSVWTFSNLLSLAYSLENVVFLKLTYALGALTVAALLVWSFFYDNRKHSPWLFVSIAFAGLVVAALSMIDSLVVGEVYRVTVTGIQVEEGSLFAVFGIYLFLSIIWSIINIARIYRRRTGIKKRQAGMALVGVSGFMLITLVVSGILPTFGIFDYTNLDSPSSIIFVLFTMVAVVKHRLLGTKVILAQILVSVLVTTSLIQLLDSQGVSDWITNSIALATVLVVGGFLVKSVMDEVRRKDELEETTKQLIAANEELRRLDVAKSEFISIASHQLRTPLSAIKGYVSLMLEGSYGAVNPTLQDALDKVYLINRHLASLVDDLLSITRIESGNVQYTFVPMRLEALAAELVDMFMVLARSRELSLVMKSPAKPLPKLMLDEGKMREVISNLIDNALKYTKKGTVTVSVEGDERAVRLIVEDTGAGITAEDMPRLFEKFIRSRNTSVIDVSGTGLGLYVSRNFVGAHGGRIWAESEGLGKGSKFIVELPVHQAKRGNS
jgi:signal transduction histidine kinase